jgi:hypothetical protein
VTHQKYRNWCVLSISIPPVVASFHNLTSPWFDVVVIRALDTAAERRTVPEFVPGAAINLDGDIHSRNPHSLADRRRGRPGSRSARPGCNSTSCNREPGYRWHPSWRTHPSGFHQQHRRTHPSGFHRPTVLLLIRSWFYGFRPSPAPEDAPSYGLRIGLRQSGRVL